MEGGTPMPKGNQLKSFDHFFRSELHRTNKMLLVKNKNKDVLIGYKYKLKSILMNNENVL